MQEPTTLSETYEAWTVQSVKAGEGARRMCRMSQELIQPETRQRVLLFAITKGEQEGPNATLVMPFGLLLSEGFRIEIAGQEILRGAYRTCLPDGCVAEIDLADATLEALESAAAASVLMTANNGQPVRADISLRGFKPAYRRLTELAAG